MTKSISVFVDSDVIVSSLLSATGAAYLLTHHPQIKYSTASLQVLELEAVCPRLNISLPRLHSLLQTSHQATVRPNQVNRYTHYVTDPHDAHIVAGAIASKTHFLTTYNHKHFKIDKLKQDFDILILTPAQFLQYLRSQN